MAWALITSRSSVQFEIRFGLIFFSIDCQGYALCYRGHLVIESCPETVHMRRFRLRQRCLLADFVPTYARSYGSYHLPHWKLPSLLPRRSERLRSWSHHSPSAFRRRARRTQTGPVPSMEHQVPSAESEKPLLSQQKRPGEQQGSVHLSETHVCDQEIMGKGDTYRSRCRCGRSG